MSLPTMHQHMTAREFAALPVGPPYSQLVEGELIFMASPTRQHQKIVLETGFRIRAYLEAHPIGEVYLAPSDVELDGGNVFEPDIYYVSRERVGILTDQGATGAPDLIVEVLSPSTAKLDLEKKRAVYLRSGVRELWFIWPVRSEIVVVRTDGYGGAEPERVLGVDEILMTPLLPGLEIGVVELFT